MARENKASATGGTVTRGKRAAAAFKIPTDNDGLIAWLNTKRDQGKPLMPETQMKLNMAYVLGNQWVSWDQRLRTYRRPEINPNDPNAPVRITSNKIGGIVERQISKLTKNVPTPECRPVSDNDNDVDAARVGTRILAHEMDRLKWNTALQKFLFWPVSIGWGFAHVWWDAEAGQYVGEDAEGELFEGEICIDYVAPFDLLVDPSADTMDAARWCIRVTTLTQEAAWEKFDVRISGGAENRSLTHEVMALGSLSDDTGGSNGNPQDWVTVYQLWMKPCKAAPEGAVITWAENEVIERKAYPKGYGSTLPFEQCDFIPGFSREGRTWVNDLISPQQDYNDSLSREATIRRQLSPKYIGAIGQINPNNITSRVEVLTYMPGFGEAPRLEMPNAAWAAQFEMGMARNASDMGERSGVSEASSGNAASTAPAATVMALQETDDTKMFVSATCLAAFIAGVGKKILTLAREYWDEERTVRVWSDDNLLSAYRYQAADIEGGLDVHVSAESALPRSKAARAQLFLELAARYPDLFDPQKLMNLLEVPQADLITQSLDQHTRCAHRENGLLLRGELPEVKPWHDHVIHLQIINGFRNSTDYYNLDEDGQIRYDAHAAVHEMLVMKQLGVKVPVVGGPGDPEAAAQAAQVDAGRSGAGVPPQGEQSGGPPQQPAGPSTADLAGIGGTGQPGQVPGVPLDTQAASIGN